MIDANFLHLQKYFFAGNNPETTAAPTAPPTTAPSGKKLFIEVFRLSRYCFTPLHHPHHHQQQQLHQQLHQQQHHQQQLHQQQHHQQLHHQQQPHQRQHLVVKYDLLKFLDFYASFF